MHVLRVAVTMGGCVATVAACTTGTPAAAGHQPDGRQAAAALLSSPGQLVDRPVASTGCGRHPGVAPGTTARLAVAVPPASAAGTGQRTFWLHVPRGYQARRPTALLLAFHGGGGTGPGMERASGLSAVGDRLGILVAYPQALSQGQLRGRPGWDASGPRDPEAHGIDDGLYVSDLLTVLQAGYCVDPARIWATGMSNGGGMVGYLACILAGRIAAFSPVEGEFYQIPGGCHPAHPAAVLDVHVRTDPVAPYAGVPGRGSPDYYALAVPDWLRAWADRDGCGPRPRTYVSARGWSGEAWDRCPAGASVQGVLFPSGGHTWFGSIGVAAGDRLLLSFLTAHRLRAAPVSWAPGAGEPAVGLTAPRIAIRAIRVFRLPQPGAEPFDLAAGPDGSMWFTEYAADRIGLISPSGVIRQYAVPTARAGPYQVAVSRSGEVWFTEYNTATIGTVSPQGRVAETGLPHPTLGGTGIATLARGGVVIADPAGSADFVPARGPVRRTPVSAALGFPFAIAQSAAGNVWVSAMTGYFEHSRHLLELSATSGRPIRTITLPSRQSNVVALAAGPGGALWFADFGANGVGRVDSHGRVSLVGLGAGFGGVSDIAAGPDGAMWVSEQDGVIARVTAGGSVTELALAPPGCDPDGIAAGPGRSIWVTETGCDAIAEIRLR